MDWVVVYDSSSTWPARTSIINCIIGNINTGSLYYIERRHNTIVGSNHYDQTGAAIPIVWGDLFVDEAGGDYRLKSGSPAINAGANAYPGLVVPTGKDLDGNPRVVGSAIDLGAYEYQDAVFDLAIDPANHTFTSAAQDYTAQAAQTFTVTNTVSFPKQGLIARLEKGTVFQISAALSPATLSAAGTATVSVRPVRGLAQGTYTDTLIITDNLGASVRATLSFTVTVPVPTPPVITTPTGALSSGTVGTAYSVTLAATNSPTSWAVSTGSLPAGLSLGNNGVISGTPTSAGTANFSVTATNSDGTSAPVAFSITINAATTFGLNPTSVTLTNADTQTAAATGNATGAITAGTLSPANANITVTPTASGVNVAYTGTLPHAGAPAAITGTHTVTITRQGENATLTINVNIPAYTPTTIPPTITSANNTTVASGTGGTFQVSATGDPTITYSLSGQPTGVSINSTTGLITIASTTAVGPYTFTITATNGVNPDATHNFTLTVTPPSDADAVSADKAALTWDVIRGTNILQTEVKANLAALPLSGANGTTISWSSDNATVSGTGTITRPAHGSGDVTVTLTAAITKNAASDTVVFSLTVKEMEAVICDTVGVGLRDNHRQRDRGCRVLR